MNDDICKPAFALKGFMGSPSVECAVLEAMSELKELRRIRAVLEEYIEANGALPGNSEYWQDKFSDAISA